jgi:hypothetical protein
MIQSVDNLKLQRWRELDATDVLIAIAEHAKQDASFRERTAAGTTRWHAAAGGREYELLCIGPKFFDTRARVGGGGAVDLAMHLYDQDFKRAVRLLRDKGL